MGKPPKVVNTAKLLKLLEQWTRADVTSRLGAFDLMRTCATTKIKKEDEIRMLLYGTYNLTVLARKFGIIRDELGGK